MVKVGWLNEVKVGETVILEFPNWERWLSQSAKQRALTAKRVQKSRAEKCNAVTVTIWFRFRYGIALRPAFSDTLSS
jgi:hypothetical protein